MQACSNTAQQLPNMSGVKLSNKDEYKLFCNIYILIYMYYLHVFVEIVCDTQILYILCCEMNSWPNLEQLMWEESIL